MGEGWVRAFSLSGKKKAQEDPHPTLSREGGRGLKKKILA
jgi:hypothetical protein